jgi:hypothetical protein
MHDENCCSGVFGRTRAPVFSLFPPCYSPVIRHQFFARKVIWIRALAEKAGENALYQVKFAVPALSAPAENAGFPRASPPHLLQIRCICSKTAIARRPPPGTIGTGAVQSGCKSAANAARRPSHRRPKPGTGANQRHAMPRGGYHDVGGYQFRGGNTPASAMHWVKGWPVAVKMGFAVGSAKVVVPLPP